jgi:hypothetical protein
LEKNSRREESVQNPDRFKRQIKYRFVFRPVREAMQIAFEVFRMGIQLPLNLHHEKRCFLQCKNRVDIKQKIIFLRNIIINVSNLFEINETAKLRQKIIFLQVNNKQFLLVPFLFEKGAQIQF